MTSEAGAPTIEREPQLRRRVAGPADMAALAVHIISNTAITGATYDIDGGQQLVVACTAT